MRYILAQSSDATSASVRKLLARLAHLCKAVGFRVLYFLPSLLVLVSGWRLIKMTHPERIGHLAGELDCVLKERALGRLPQRKLKLLAARRTVANPALLDYWAEHVSVVGSSFWCALLDPLYRFRYLRYQKDMTRYLVAINATAQLAEIQSLWGNRPPLLATTALDLARGRAALAQWELPPDARFVCFHNREGGYSPQDEHLHSYRNSAIESYLDAMHALTQRGIWCIRMGDPSTRPLPPIEKVIDYAHSPLRADWLDLFLCAQSTFFVGNTSGLFIVASAFGVPCCLTNLIPFSAGAAFGPPKDLGIPKLLREATTGRYLKFGEILALPLGNYRFTELYEKFGAVPVENSPDDLCDVVLEMLDRVEGKLDYAPEDEALQARFKALLRPGHYSYGGASRVGRAFLRKYAHLLD